MTDEHTVREGFWPKMAKVGAQVPFADRLVAAYYCALDPATPLKAKAVLFGALAYFIMPFDLVPDFIAGLGFTDDLAVLIGAYKVLGQHLKPEHLAKAREKLAEIRTRPA